jgi:hypothetical protein
MDFENEAGLCAHKLTLLDHPDGKYLAAIAIFMILFLVFHLGRRSA